MNMERDKFLTEYLGECWHLYGEPEYYSPIDDDENIYVCEKCGRRGSDYNRSLSTWAGFGWLWEKCQEQEWWDDLVDGLAPDDINYGDTIDVDLIHPDRFANAVYEYLKEQS